MPVVAAFLPGSTDAVSVPFAASLFFAVCAVGAVFPAAGVTAWIVPPILLFVLHFLHQWRSDRPVWQGNHHFHGAHPS